MAGGQLDEQRVAAYVRGELDAEGRAAVEAALDADPKWLAVVAVMARGDGASSRGVPNPGVRIGRYTVGELLGRGATGIVVAAWDPELRRDIALKLVEPALLSDPARAQARLSREAKALARVEDPHVVRVLDVGLWQRRVFVAMERLDGGTLDAWRTERARAWTEVVQRWLDAGEGLAAAHAQGLIHRDFKPANVMLDASGRVVVVDFGLARQVATPSTGAEASAPSGVTSSHDFVDLTRTGAEVGTPAYMPPEQRTGRVVDPAADQYAFCVSLYEALAGVLPNGVVRVTMPAVVGRVPRRVWSLLERGRAKEPSHRHDGMRPLLDALARSIRRRPWISRGGPAALVVGVGAAALLGDGDERCDVQRRASPAEGVVEDLRGRPEPFAEAIADRVMRGSDLFAREWSSQRALACGEFAAGAIDDAELDRRVLCLDAQHRRAVKVMDALRDPTALALRHADRIVALLPNASRCTQAEDAPLDPGTRRRIEAIIDGATELEMGRLLGGSDGVSKAVELVRRADALGRPRQRGSARQQLGLEYETHGELAAASRTYQEGADIAMAANLPGLSARLLVRTAWVVGYTQANVEEGRRWVEHAAAWSKRSGVDVALEADRLQTLGFIELTAGDLEAAHAAFAAAFAQAEAIDAEHPERDELVIFALNGLGSVAVSSGDLEDGRVHLTEAARLQAEKVGEGHPSVAQIQNNVAGLLHAEGRSEEARAIFEANLEVFRQSYGETNYNVGMTLVNLAVLSLDVGDGAAALGYAADAHRIAERSQGPTALATAKALALLGEARHSQGQTAQGLANLREARSIFVAAVGDFHSEVGATDEAIAGLLLAQAKPSEAHAACRSALSILTQSWGDADSRLAKVWLVCGRAEHALGRASEAERSLRRAVELDAALAEEANDLLATLQRADPAAG